jgi:hypothetical protein
MKFYRNYQNGIFIKFNNDSVHSIRYYTTKAGGAKPAGFSIPLIKVMMLNSNLKVLG